MQKDISPEEKLLSIIKGKRKPADSSGAQKGESEGNKESAAGIWAKMDSYLLTALGSSFLKNIFFDPRILKVFNRYMVLALIIAAVYLIYDIVAINPSKRAALIIAGEQSARKSAISITQEREPVETKNYSYYSNKISGRNIFNAGPYDDAAYKAGSSPAGKPEEETLGLVGIIPGASPQAIIEDKKAQKTYYFTKGQTSDDITVDDISENKVVLEYKGKIITLFL